MSRTMRKCDVSPCECYPQGACGRPRPERVTHRFQVTLLVDVTHDTSDPWDEPDAERISDAFLDALDRRVMETDYGRRIELSDDYRRAIRVVEL